MEFSFKINVSHILNYEIVEGIQDGYRGKKKKRISSSEIDIFENFLEKESFFSVLNSLCVG